MSNFNAWSENIIHNLITDQWQIGIAFTIIDLQISIYFDTAEI